MTRKELEIRARAVECAYRDDDIDAGIEYAFRLYERNVQKKLYRFRPPKMREIETIRAGEIYLARPKYYKDTSDCEWLDDIDELVKYEVQERNYSKYKAHKKLFTNGKYEEIAEKVMNEPRYIQMKERARNMCLTACITDKIDGYMWTEYANDSQGICLEYDFLEVLIAIKNNDLWIFPVRYVDERNRTKDIQFGVNEYVNDESGELMAKKYMLSCLTKNKHPYSKDSEWRVICKNTDETIEKGKMFQFIKPSRIYMGKNISNNLEFEQAVLELGKQLNIAVEYT